MTKVLTDREILEGVIFQAESLLTDYDEIPARFEHIKDDIIQHATDFCRAVRSVKDETAEFSSAIYDPLPARALG